MFKKILLSVFAIFSLFSANAFGQEVAKVSTDFILGVSVPASEIEGGTTMDVAVSLKGAVSVNDSVSVEYGVARELKRGYITFFENISREVVSAKDLTDKLSVFVPNIAKASKDTYVVYVKTYKENDPDSEHFVTSKSFSLRPGSSKFVSIKHANLLQSNNKRTNLMSGPTIYNPSETTANSGLANSSSLEITLESNTSTTLNPVIKFSKLRTDSFELEVSTKALEVKEGDNYFVIPLPTFDYAPGVYVGSMEFNSPLIKNTVQFQFIVAGDAVTVGQVNYVDLGENHSFIYDIFGTPVDLENVQEKDLEKKIYNVSLSYLKGTKEVFSDMKQVDFDEKTFESLVPAKFKKIDSVKITVTSKDGKVVYEGEKDLNISVESGGYYKYFALGVALILLIVLFIIRKKRVNGVATVGTALLLFLSVIGGAQVFAAWIPTGSFVTDFRATVYNVENDTLVKNLGGTDKLVPKISFNEDVSSKVYQTGEDFSFYFKAVFLLCDNVVHGISTGFSFVSIADAEAKRAGMDVNSSDGSKVLETNVGVHNFYTQTIDFGKAELGVLDRTKTHLYAHIYHNPLTGSNVDGYSNYKIPLKIAPPNPNGLTATPSASCGGKVDLSWSSVSSVAGYKVYRSTSATGGFVEIANVTTTTYTDTAPAPSTTYFYKVTAYHTGSGTESDLISGTVVGSSSSDSCTCADGSAIPSDGVCPTVVTSCPDGSALPADGVCRCSDGSVMPADGKCPGTPPSITTISSISTSCEGITGTRNILRFSATSSKYPVTYKVLRKLSSASTFTEIGTYTQPSSGDTNPTYTDPSLEFNTSYDYRVSASNDFGTGPVSVTSSVNTKTESQCKLEGEGGGSCDADKKYDGDKCCSVPVVAGVCPDDGDDGRTPGKHSFCRSKGGLCSSPKGKILNLNGLLTHPSLVKSGETCTVYLRGETDPDDFSYGFNAFEGVGGTGATCTLSGPGIPPVNFNPSTLLDSKVGAIKYTSNPITGTSIYTLKCSDAGIVDVTVSATCRVVPKEVEVSFFDRLIKTSSRLKDGLLGAVLFSIGVK